MFAGTTTSWSNAHSCVPQSDSGKYTTFDDYLWANFTKKYDEMRGVIYAYRYPDFKWVVTEQRSVGRGYQQGFADGRHDDRRIRFRDRFHVYDAGHCAASWRDSILFTRACAHRRRSQGQGAAGHQVREDCATLRNGDLFHNATLREAEIARAVGGAAGWCGRLKAAVGAADAANTQRTEGRLYACSNIVRLRPRTTNDDLLIARSIKRAGGRTARLDKITYYRFNLAKLGESQILRHQLYLPGAHP